VDYDADFTVEPASDGFVDLYDFARLTAQRYSAPEVVISANQVLSMMNQAVVAERHNSGSPWMALNSSGIWRTSTGCRFSSHWASDLSWSRAVQGAGWKPASRETYTSDHALRRSNLLGGADRSLLPGGGECTGRCHAGAVGRADPT
jgi:hypothetical protein